MAETDLMMRTWLKRVEIYIKRFGNYLIYGFDRIADIFRDPASAELSRLRFEDRKKQIDAESCFELDDEKSCEILVYN
jgi:hypothetical protein